MPATAKQLQNEQRDAAGDEDNDSQCLSSCLEPGSHNAIDLTKVIAAMIARLSPDPNDFMD